MCLMFPWLFHHFLHASFLETHSQNLRTCYSSREQKRVFLKFIATLCRELVPHDFRVVVLHRKTLNSFHLWCMLEGSV